MGVNAFVISSSFISGLLSIIIGALKLGQLFDFISAPTIIGFTSGSAISTQISQIPSLLGIKDVNNYQAAYLVLYNTGVSIVSGKVTLDATISISVFMFLVIWRVGCQKLVAISQNRKHLATLLGNAGNAMALIVFTLISFLVNSSRPSTFQTFDAIPSGFSYLRSPDLTNFIGLLPPAGTIVLVSIIDQIAICKSLGRQNGYTIDVNQEIIALGITNLLGSFVGAFPGTGSFSRSAVKARSGAKSPMSLFTALIILLAIYYMTGVFSAIPTASLAAIVCFSLMDLVCKPAYLRTLWRVDKADMVVFLLSFWIPMFTSIEMGIYCSVIFSILISLYKISRPTVRALVKDQSGSWIVNKGSEDIKIEGFFGPPRGIAVFRIDESITFSNSSHINATIYRWVVKCTG